jgi:hypothetical protein
VELFAWIHNVMDLDDNPNPRVGPAPLPGGVASARVSTLDPISAAFMILYFHYACDLVQGLGAVAASHGVPTHPRIRCGEKQSVPPMRKLKLGERGGRERTWHATG